MHDKKPSARLWRWLGGVGGGRQIRISGMGGFGVLHRLSLSLSLSPPTHHHQKTKLIGKFALSFRNMEKGGGGKRALGSPANEHSPIIWLALSYLIHRGPIFHVLLFPWGRGGFFFFFVRWYSRERKINSACKQGAGMDFLCIWFAVIAPPRPNPPGLVLSPGATHSNLFFFFFFLLCWAFLRAGSVIHATRVRGRWGDLSFFISLFVLITGGGVGNLLRGRSVYVCIFVHEKVSQPKVSLSVLSLPTALCCTGGQIPNPSSKLSLTGWLARMMIFP